MPVSIESNERKSTIVRALRHRSNCPYFGRARADSSYAASVRERLSEPRERRAVVLPLPDRQADRPSRFGRLMVAVLAAIVAGYAVAVIARVIVAYGA